MPLNTIRKIIYFDKETIRNILQERHHGDYTKKVEASSSVQNEGAIGTEVTSKVKLEVPFFSKLSFLFTGKIDASYIVKKDSSTTITSTELSEFEKLKSFLIEMSDVQLHDIENSSTSLRVAGGYVRIIKGGIEGVDIKEFKAVMDNYDGYDTYSIDETKYVRFNNSAFVSNYKRNDLLTTKMTLYCIPVGEFERNRFDFVAEFSKMENLFSKANKTQTLGDVYPPQNSTTNSIGKKPIEETKSETQEDMVELYDVLYACIDARKEK